MAKLLARSGVYLITSPSGKEYVGSTRCFRNRWAGHLHGLRRGTHHSSALQNAYIKYGEGAIKFSVLLVCSSADAVMYEQRAINALKPAYNMSPTAGSPAGVKHGPMPVERKRKISEANTGKKRSAAHKAKFSEAQRNRTARFNLAEHRRGKEPHNKKRVTHDGITQTLVEWGETAGLAYSTLKRRMQLGWSFADVIGRPIRKR